MRSRTFTVVPPTTVGSGKSGCESVVVDRFAPKADVIDTGASAAPLKLAAETLFTTPTALVQALSGSKSPPTSLPSVPAFLYGLAGARRELPRARFTKPT